MILWNNAQHRSCIWPCMGLFPCWGKRGVTQPSDCKIYRWWVTGDSSYQLHVLSKKI